MALKMAVSQQPVTVAIAANTTDFDGYRGGIFKGPCSPTLTHAMLVVGYNTTDDGVDFWILKNSWGKYWGEAGYMRLLRGDEANGGVCGVMLHMSYPVDAFDLDV
jgi:C1A family cysteine protease